MHYVRCGPEVLVGGKVNTNAMHISCVKTMNVTILNSGYLFTRFMRESASLWLSLLVLVPFFNIFSSACINLCICVTMAHASPYSLLLNSLPLLTEYLHC
jgi:hypothetical protein